DELGPRSGGPPNVLQDLNRLRVPLEIRDRYPAVGEHEIGMAVQVEVDPGSPPSGERPAERRRERRSVVLERRTGRDGLLPGVDRMALTTRVRAEEIGAPVTVEVGGRDPHPRVRIRHAGARRALFESKAEPGRVGLPSAGPRDVLVQPIRVAVVGDVEIRSPVAVEVGEDSTEAVVEPRGFEPGLNAELAEARAAVPV